MKTLSDYDFVHAGKTYLAAPEEDDIECCRGCAFNIKRRCEYPRPLLTVTDLPCAKEVKGYDGFIYKESTPCKNQ